MNLQIQIAHLSEVAEKQEKFGLCFVLCLLYDLLQEENEDGMERLAQHLTNFPKDLKKHEKNRVSPHRTRDVRDN